MIKFKDTLLENSQNKYIQETEVLFNKANSEYNNLIETLRQLRDKSNGGSNYFSGYMMNPYNIKKNEPVSTKFEEMTNALKGNALYNLAKVGQNISDVKRVFIEIKKLL